MRFIQDASISIIHGTAYHFGVRLASNRALVGAAGMWDIDKDECSCEVGVWIGKEHWGNGYARSALILISYYAFKQVGLAKEYAKVMDFNSRSIAMLNTLGFIKDRDYRQIRPHYRNYVEENRYTIAREEFEGKYGNIDDIQVFK